MPASFHVKSQTNLEIRSANTSFFASFFGAKHTCSIQKECFKSWDKKRTSLEQHKENSSSNEDLYVLDNIRDISHTNSLPEVCDIMQDREQNPQWFLLLT